MKVKIKKEGKVKQFKLINSWADVTLSTWISLVDFATGTKTEEATETIAALSDIPKQLVKELALSDVAVIMSKIAELQAKQDTTLKRIIEINDVEYGFHPDLDKITLGEYADIEQFIKNGIETNLPELMAILYRPIKGENYQNLKTQCYYKLADQINKGQIGVSCSDVNVKNYITEELEQVRTKDADKDNKLQIIPKDTVKSILGRSPDYADALAMRMFYEIDSNFGRYYVQ